MPRARARKFFAKAAAPEAEFSLEAIPDVYLVEHETKARRLELSETHLNTRNEPARP